MFAVLETILLEVGRSLVGNPSVVVPTIQPEISLVVCHTVRCEVCVQRLFGKLVEIQCVL